MAEKVKRHISENVHWIERHWLNSSQFGILNFYLNWIWDWTVILCSWVDMADFCLRMTGV